MPHTRAFVDRVTPLITEALILELAESGALVRFMGGDLAARWQQDFTGACLEGFLSPDEQDRFRGHTGTVCRHPVGLWARGEVPTSRGRQVEYEMLVLPLAVDSGRPLRCVVYRGNRAVLDFRESKIGFMWPAEVSWIDIGAGLPA